ncbi:hypothetical protein FocTR4_00002118 [Fusarium oxysporum f. sp. cubense]|uniref:Uncharacterized protein n=1 Tax=Fusarium oxysporum f. sp. cubense TaxID=61366 RepID=A0A5C6T379_FUSOC|nr:hypothetical protein FocTR4_00002118 [Fusarium oxysporum f. sp. cubense]
MTKLISMIKIRFKTILERGSVGMCLAPANISIGNRFTRAPAPSLIIDGLALLVTEFEFQLQGMIQCASIKVKLARLSDTGRTFRTRNLNQVHRDNNNRTSN